MSSVPPALGSRFQHTEFALPELAGMSVRALVVDFGTDASVQPERDSTGVVRYTAESALFFLKPSGRHWQRFFLDAGLGFLGEFDEGHEYADIREELQEPGCIDVGVRHGLLGATIATFVCGERADVPGTSFTVSFVDGRELVYSSSDAMVLDSPIVVVIKPGS